MDNRDLFYNLLLTFIYVGGVVYHCWFMRVEIKATWPRAFIACLLWPITGLLAVWSAARDKKN